MNERKNLNYLKIEHETFVQTVKEIMEDLKGCRFYSTGQQGVAGSYPFPDLINMDKTIAVEVGNLSNGKTKVNDLLEHYMEVYWFPFPKFSTKFNLPILQCIRFSNKYFEDIEMQIKKIEREKERTKVLESQLTELLQSARRETWALDQLFRAIKEVFYYEQDFDWTKRVDYIKKKAEEIKKIYDNVKQDEGDLHAPKEL